MQVTEVQIVVFYPRFFAAFRLHPLLPCFSLFPLFSFQGAVSGQRPDLNAQGFEHLDPFSGGDKRIRTADPLRAKQVLSQLSYTPPSGENGGP